MRDSCDNAEHHGNARTWLYVWPSVLGYVYINFLAMALVLAMQKLRKPILSDVRFLIVQC